MSELRAFLENQKERWGIVKELSEWPPISPKTQGVINKLCEESIQDIDLYLERHEPAIEDYEHFKKEKI